MSNKSRAANFWAKHDREQQKRDAKVIGADCHLCGQHYEPHQLDALNIFDNGRCYACATDEDWSKCKSAGGSAICDSVYEGCYKG